MKVEAGSEQIETMADTSVEDARWLLGAVCFIGGAVLLAGLIAASFAS